VDGAILLLPIRIQFVIKSNLSEAPWGRCALGLMSAINND
jgi:hypothetical protein